MTESSERRILARGTIRVDARRAAAKLREHLLVDLHSYTLELTRAALRLGAKRMVVRWDADDVVLAFDGEPIAPARLSRLLDFALADAADDRARALRTLALGVNAALGLGAQQVDVVTSEAGNAQRARWTPALIEQAEGSTCAETQLPTEAFETGTWVHVRQALGIDVVKRAIVRDVPREVALLTSCTHDTPLDIRINGAPPTRPVRAEPLLRIPIEVAGTTSARVEILPAGSPCSMELLERGVRLLSGAWVPLTGLESQAEASVPARVVIDAEELPTNASRSALREDSTLAAELDRAAAEGFRSAVKTLTASVLGSGETSDNSEILSDGQSLENALGAIVHVAVLAARSQKPVEPDVAALLELPLVHGAGGERIAAGRFVTARWTHVWRERALLPIQLAPWLGHVVLLRGHRIEKILDGLELVDATELVERAHSGSARRQRLLAHPAAEPRVPRTEMELLRGRFRFESGPESGLYGEVVLLAPTTEGKHASRLRVYVEQRLLEVIPLDPSFCPLALDAALAWPSGLRPRFEYDAVERDARLNEAAFAVSRIAIGKAARAAARLPRLGDAERAALETVLRNAVAAWSVVPERLGFAPPDKALNRDFPALWRARIFPTTEAGRNVSLEDLDKEARRARALCVARGARGRAVDGRPVLDVSAEAMSRIVAALHRPVTIVPYDRALDASTAVTPEGRRAALVAVIEQERQRQGLAPAGPLYSLDLPDTVALASPGRAGRVIESHLGVVLRSREREGSKIPLIAAFDDARSVPNEEWSDVKWAPARQLAVVSGQLAEHLVEALEGDPDAQRALGSSVLLDEGTSTYLLEVATSVKARGAASKTKRGQKKLTALAERIEALPLLATLDRSGASRATSLREVTERHGNAPPLLRALPGFETLDWFPVLVRHPEEQEVVLRLFPAARWAEEELPRRLADAVVERRRQELLALPPQDLRDLSPMAVPGEPSAFLPATAEGEAGSDLEAVVGLPRPDLRPSATSLRVSYERRTVAQLSGGELGVPVVAAVDTKRMDDLVELRLTPRALERIRGRVVLAAAQLAGQLMDAARGPGASGLVLSDARALALCLFLLGRGQGAAVQHQLTGQDLLWPTIQGGEAPFGSLQRSGTKLWFGQERFPEWRRRQDGASDLDAPILQLAAGPTFDLSKSVLEQLGFELADVSEAASRLQAQRGGATPSAPILVGLPPHAALRAKSWELGLTLGDGEVELIEGPSSDVSLVLLGGVTSRHSPALWCPVRAALRVDALDESTVKGQLAPALESAATRLVCRAVDQLERMPHFVRSSARRAVCRCTSTGEPLPDELTGARIFEDTAGAWWSLGELVSRGSWNFTSFPGPYPVLKTPLLILSRDEAASLGTLLSLTLADRAIVREREAEARRNAPVLERIALHPEERAACIVTTEIQTSTCIGEVGVLAPNDLERHGVALYSSRRPLCRLDDGSGWPLVAAVEDARVQPDRWFAAPANPSAVAEVRTLIRESARQSLKRVFSPPVTALASHWLDDVAHGGFRVTGCLWLNSSFPAVPSVRVRIPLQPLPVARPLLLDCSSFAGNKALPIEGDLLVRLDGNASSPESTVLDELELLADLWPALGELGAEIAKRLLNSAIEGGTSPSVQEHAFSLALLGLDVTPPEVRALDGESITVARVCDELATRGIIWLSDGRGWIEGELPTAAPSFVLRDDGSPLARVLEQRTNPGGVRRLGARVPPTHVLGSSRLAHAPPPPVPDLGAPDVRAFTTKNRFARLSAALSRLFGSEPPPKDPTTHDEIAPLLRALHELSLSGNPVQHVVVGAKRAAIEYLKRERRLRVDADRIGALLAHSTNDPEALHVLTAAAVSEVNRALTEVTDAEERRALVALLKEL